MLFFRQIKIYQKQTIKVFIKYFIINTILLFVIIYSTNGIIRQTMVKKNIIETINEIEINLDIIIFITSIVYFFALDKQMKIKTLNGFGLSNFKIHKTVSKIIFLISLTNTTLIAPLTKIKIKNNQTKTKKTTILDKNSKTIINAYINKLDDVVNLSKIMIIIDKKKIFYFNSGKILNNKLELSDGYEIENYRKIKNIKKKTIEGYVDSSKIKTIKENAKIDKKKTVENFNLYQKLTITKISLINNITNYKFTNIIHKNIIHDLSVPFLSVIIFNFTIMCFMKKRKPYITIIYSVMVFVIVKTTTTVIENANNHSLYIKNIIPLYYLCIYLFSVFILKQYESTKPTKPTRNKLLL